MRFRAFEMGDDPEATPGPLGVTIRIFGSGLGFPGASGLPLPLPVDLSLSVALPRRRQARPAQPAPPGPRPSSVRLRVHAFTLLEDGPRGRRRAGTKSRSKSLKETCCSSCFGQQRVHCAFSLCSASLLRPSLSARSLDSPCDPRIPFLACCREDSTLGDRKPDVRRTSPFLFLLPSLFEYAAKRALARYVNPPTTQDRSRCLRDSTDYIRLSPSTQNTQIILRHTHHDHHDLS